MEQGLTNLNYVAPFISCQLGRNKRLVKCLLEQYIQTRHMLLITVGHTKCIHHLSGNTTLKLLHNIARLVL